MGQCNSKSTDERREERKQQQRAQPGALPRSLQDHLLGAGDPYNALTWYRLGLFLSEKEQGDIPDDHIISICNVSVDSTGDGELSLVGASSEEVTGYAIECLNTDLSTQWHTQFKKKLPTFPHTLTLKLEQPQTISCINIILLYILGRLIL